MDGDPVFYLESGVHGVNTDGNYVIRHDAENSTYFATRVAGDAAQGYYFDNYSEQQTNLNDMSITGLTERGKMPPPDAIETKARIKDVEMIMVRDGDLMSISDDEQIWSQLSTADVDFYVDMSHIYGPTSQQISGLGSGTIDNFGAGYDVQTSAKVNSFGNDNNLAVYYDGNHEDFTDIYDRINTETPGQWSMVKGDTTNGSNWATEVAANTNGGGGSFFIVVGGKKIAVKHSNNEWIADNTALSIAQGVTMGDGNVNTIDTNYKTTEENFIADVIDRYGLPKLLIVQTIHLQNQYS